MRHAADDLSGSLEHGICDLEAAGGEIDADGKILVGLRVSRFLSKDLATSIRHRGTGNNVLLEWRVRLEDRPGCEKPSGRETEETELSGVDRELGSQQRDHFGRDPPQKLRRSARASAFRRFELLAVALDGTAELVLPIPARWREFIDPPPGVFLFTLVRGGPNADDEQRRDHAFER